jgi:hypothetical protein
MDASRFDRLARLLAQRTSRRRAGQVLGSLAAAGTLGSTLAPKSVLAVLQSVAVCPDAADHVSLGTQGAALTFTPNISAKLSEVRVKIVHSWEPEMGYVLRILGTDASGRPTLNRVLAKKAIPYEAFPSAGFVDLIAKFKKRKAIKVVAGKTYAIFVTRPTADFGTTVAARASNPCPNATFFNYSRSDKSFAEGPDTDIPFEVFVGYE